MNRITHTGFVLIILTLINTILFSQEKTLPENAEMIKLMRQYGINPQVSNNASNAQFPGMQYNFSPIKMQNGSKEVNELFDNGPFVTHPGAGVGGADFSMTYAPYQSTGYNANSPNYRITDDFVVTGDEGWTIESVRLFAFQNLSPTTPSPITGAYIQIWDAAPYDGGTVIWGDVVTNLMNSTKFANCYRGSDVSQTNRAIMEVNCETPNLVLDPGTYWIDYTFIGTTGMGYGVPQIIPVTITGEPITGNAYYTFNAGGYWFWLGSVVYHQGAPFTIFGYTGDPQAPEAIDDLTITPAAMGALSADLTWTNPSFMQTGDPLTELASVSIYRGDVLIYEDTSPGIGTAETFTDTPGTPGLYYYEIFSANANGNSPKTGSEVYVGEDVPAAPSNVLLTPINNFEDAEITWDAPTEGLNGAYFTGATAYTIIRMPDSIAVATNWSGTQPFVDNTLPAFGYYTYRVIALNAVGAGGTGTSNGELLGPFVYTRSAYANNFANHEFVSVDVITGRQTFIANNTFDPTDTWPKESVATFAEGVYYVGDAVNSEIFIKTDDGTEVPLGPVMLNGEQVIPNGLAYDASSSTMYITVISPTTFLKSLCTINLSTLELTVISSQIIIYDNSSGLEYLPDGYLYTVNISNEELIKIDPATGNQTVVGPIGFNADNIQTLSYEPTLNRLYTYLRGWGDDRYGYYDLNTGLFNSLTNNLETYNSGFAIKDPMVLQDVDAVAFYVETPEVVKNKFGVGETTPVNVKVGNYGLTAASFEVTVQIGDNYSETINVANLGSIQETELVFPDWTPTLAGAYDLVLTVSDPGGDGNLENNTVSRVVDVYDGCRHTLILYALYNDSWQGDWASVHINSQIYYDYITKPAGNPFELPVYAEEGDEIKFTYYGDGLWNDEHSWELLDGEGIQLFTGVGVANTVIEQTAAANCFGIAIDIKVYLEGPYDHGSGNIMLTDLATEGYIPLNQPFNPSLPYYGNDTPVWLYSGTETLNEVPSETVDWVLVQLREEVEPSKATAASIVATQPALLMSDGSVKGLNGNSLPFFAATSITQNLYVVIYHRNHLAIMSANAVFATDNIYSYDFSTAVDQAYGTDAQKDLGSGIWGMYVGDCDASGEITETDKNNAWIPDAGKSGYLGSDLNLDGQSENIDKNDFILLNLNKSIQLPD